MEKQQFSGYRAMIVFALIAGLGANATINGLFNSTVGFSLFPLLTCALAGYCGYRYCLQSSVVPNLLSVAGASFFVGYFGHASYLRAIEPSMGSNFIMLMIMLSLAIWISFKSGLISR